MEVQHPSPFLDLGQTATAACLLEISTPKPGNVHRGADFEDMTFEQMALAAVAIGPAVERCRQEGIGLTVLAAIEATHDLVGKNTNLGTVLLLAPLATSATARPASVREALDRMTPNDAEAVYRAIRLAKPGGLGKADAHDVAQPAPKCLLEAMGAAAERDMVARQYANGFTELLETVVPNLLECQEISPNLPAAIVRAYLMTMAQFPDSLIARKLGTAIAQESADRAAAALEAGAPGDERYHRAVADFDFWLRSDGHRRNPGTSADLIAAALFVCLREGTLSLRFC